MPQKEEPDDDDGRFSDATGHWITNAQHNDVGLLFLGANAHLSLLAKTAMLGCIQVTSRHSTTSTCFKGLDELLNSALHSFY